MSPMTTPIARTPVHDWHVRNGGRMVEKEGWFIADNYGAVEDETTVAHRGSGLVDLSAFAKISVRGAGVQDFARTLVGHDRGLEPLGVVRFDTAGSGQACRLAHDHLLLLTEAIQPKNLLDQLEQAPARSNLLRHDVTSAFAEFGLAGPGVENILSCLTSLDPSALSPGSCPGTNLAGVHAVLVRPAEANCLQICVAWDLGEYVWERLLEIGKRYGIRPVGLATWERIKAARPPCHHMPE